MKIYNSYIFRVILSIVLIIMIVIGGFSIKFFIRGIQEEYKETYSENTKVLELIKKTIQNEIDQVEISLQIIGLNKNFQTQDFEEIDYMTQKIVKENKLIDQIYYIDKNGNQTYKTSHLETLGDRSYREYFKEAIKGNVYLSNGLVSNSTEEAITVLAIPIYSETEVIGVLAATLNLSSIYEYIESIKLGKNGYAFLVDREGILIAHPEKFRVYNFENVSYLEPVKEMIEKKDGIGEYKYKSIKKLIVYEYLDNIGWGLAVQIPEEEALVNIRNLQKEFLAYVILILLIVSIITLILTKIYSKYFNEFVDKIRNLRTKNYEIPFIKIRTDEIGAIQIAINEMSRETKQSKENLELIVERRTRKLKQSLDTIKENELELKRKNKKLENTLNELAVTEERLFENKKIQSLNRLSNNLAHEINTPLGIILTNISYAQLETKGLDKKLKEEKISKKVLEKYLNQMQEIIEMEGEQAEKLKNILNAFQAMSINGAQFEKTEIELSKEIQKFIYLYKNKYKEDINIRSNIEEDIVIKTYPMMMGNIIEQFIKNSYSHGREENKQINVDIEMKREKDKIKIRYKDDGIGMKTQDASKSFEPFYKGKMGSKGIGLGLSLVYNVVTILFEGKINLDSYQNKGIEINVEFEI